MANDGSSLQIGAHVTAHRYVQDANACRYVHIYRSVTARREECDCT